MDECEEFFAPEDFYPTKREEKMPLALASGTSYLISTMIVSVLKDPLKKRFWIISYITYLLVTLFSYGYIKELYFYSEDFVDIYHFLFGGNQPFPYHGIKYLLYPLYLIFGTQPSGYFLVTFVLYTILAFLLEFVIWIYSKNKLLAFISGLIFATGYIGSNTMSMVEMAIPEIIYLISLLGILFFYKRYIDSHSLKSWSITFFTYSFLLLFISQRAHSLIFIIFITDIFLTWNPKGKLLLENIFNSIKRILPFIITFVGIYLGLPFLLSSRGIGNYIGTVWIWQSYRVLSFDSYLVFLSDLGNYLVPSFYQEKIIELLQKLSYNLSVLIIISTLGGLFILLILCLNTLLKKRGSLYFFNILLLFNTLALISFSKGRFNLLLGSLIGQYLLYFISGLLIFIKMNLKIRKLLIFLSTSWIASYFIFHLHEAERVHFSDHYYLLSGFPFFTSIIASIFAVFISLKPTIKMKLFGYGFLAIIFSSYISAAHLSKSKQGYLERSYYLQNFISSLKGAVPQLTGDKNLFYFDVVNNNETIDIFKSLLYTGTINDEIALATIYKVNKSQIKIVKDYSSFIKEKNEGNFRKTYAFFYNENNKLYDLTKSFNPNSILGSLIINDFSEIKTILHDNDSEKRSIIEKNNNITYKSIIESTSDGSYSKNSLLELILEDFNFPSLKPISLEITLTAINLSTTVNNYPYYDASDPKFPVEINSSTLGEADNMESVLKYIEEREKFRKLGNVQSSGDYYPYKIQNVMDGFLDTSWKPWFGGKPAWIKVTFPKEFTFSEVRWITTEANPPTNYIYQISSSEDGPWETILSVSDRKINTGEYVDDEVPTTTAKYFRMELSEFKLDNPYNIDNPTISEIELIKTSSNVDSREADFFLNHPLAYIENETKMHEIISVIKDHLLLGIYPITDKYLDKNNSQLAKSNFILDGKQHTYTFILPPGGTKIRSLLIEFPNVPIFAQIEKLSLTQIE